jgi:hypothetical protein
MELAQLAAFVAAAAELTAAIEAFAELAYRLYPRLKPSPPPANQSGDPGAST